MLKPLLLAVLLSVGLCGASGVFAQHFSVNASGPLVMRTNRSVSKVIEVTRLDTVIPEHYGQSVYALTQSVRNGNYNSSSIFSTNIYPLVAFNMEKDSTIEIIVTFNAFHGSDTMYDSLIFVRSDSADHPFDTIPLIGISDRTNRDDFQSDVYDSIQIDDSEMFPIQDVGSSEVKSYTITNLSNQPLTIDSAQILGNTHSNFILRNGLNPGETIAPYQSASFLVRYFENGVTGESNTPILITYHDPQHVSQSIFGDLRAKAANGIAFGLPDSLFNWAYDSVPVLQLDTIAAGVDIFGTMTIRSFVPEPVAIELSTMMGGGMLIFYSDSGGYPIIAPDTILSYPYVFRASDLWSDFTTTQQEGNWGINTDNSYNMPPIQVDGTVFFPDTARLAVPLYHNQTIGIPMGAEDTIADSILFPNTTLWLTNGTSDTLWVKLAKLWNGTNFIANVHSPTCPFPLAPREEVKVDLSLVQGEPYVDTILGPNDIPMVYYSYWDEFMVETDSSYDPGMNGTRIDNSGTPRIITQKSAVNIPSEDISQTASVFPNPSSVSATLQYQLESAGPITILISDELGRIVRTIVKDQYQSAGEHSTTFSTKDLTNGIYSCSIVSSNQKLFTKFLVQNP